MPLSSLKVMLASSLASYFGPGFEIATDQGLNIRWTGPFPFNAVHDYLTLWLGHMLNSHLLSDMVPVLLERVS